MWRVSLLMLVVLLALAAAAAAPQAYAAAGDLLWSQTFNTDPPGTFTYDKTAVSAIGDVFLACSSDRGAGRGQDWVVVRYGAGGDFKWVRYYGGAGKDVLRSLAADRYGNVVLCGARAGGAASGTGFATVKFSRAGKLLWARRIDGTKVGGADTAMDIVVDGSGRVYVTGEVVQTATGRDFLTVKYGTGGKLLWQRRHSSSGASGDGARVLARDAAGNVYVAGDVAKSGSGQDLRVIRYKASGFRDWVFTWGNTEDRNELAADIAVRDSGVVVCGTVWPEEQGFIVQLPRSGLGGWRKTFNPLDDGVTGSSWLATGIDAAGRVTVAGYTEIGDKSLGPDFAVQRFGAGGALLNSYGSPGGATEMAQGVAVTAAGAVYATGHGPYDGVRHPLTLGWDADWNPLFDGKTHVGHYIDVSEMLVLGSDCFYVGGWGFDSMTGEGADLVLLKYAR